MKELIKLVAQARLYAARKAEASSQQRDGAARDAPALPELIK